MAGQATLSLFLLGTAIAAAVLLLSASQAAAAPPRFKDLCAQTGYPDLCRPIVKRMKSPRRATEATIKTLLAKTKEARAEASRFKNGNQAIGVCYSTFSDAICDLEKALRGIKARDNFGLNVHLSAVVSDYGTCCDAFLESGQVNTLQNTADALRKIGCNCLSLSTMIL